MRVTKYKIGTDKKIGNLRIALFSDIHYSGRRFSTKLLSKILLNIESNHPDYICIPGDIIDNVLDIQNNVDQSNLLSFLNKLGQIAPVIISLGNHDVQKGLSRDHNYCYPIEFVKKIRNIPNVYLLDNEYLKINNINFYGLTYSYDYYFKKSIEGRICALDYIKKYPVDYSKTEYNILLSHTPLIFENSKVLQYINNCDLILSGHMHNGTIPILLDSIIKSDRGIIGPGKGFFPKFCRGKLIINDGNTTMVISKGITTVSKMAPFIFKIFRPFYPPNIEYINLESSNEKK